MLRLLLLAAFLSALLAASASAEVRWLCGPGVANDPCRGDLTTRVIAPDGSSKVEQVAVPAAPKVDCFYVYPTVSNQPTSNATQTADPEVRSIATYQAQRFSSRCRVFAPLYRQVTAAGVSAASQTRQTAPYETALADVREAFAAFLKESNGRPFVLLGHSQGSRMLRATIRRDVDPNPAVRKLMVSALIPGANVTVARGRRVGGDFENVPACERPSQVGCVVSFHTFNEPAPANARFGRTETDPVGGALDLPVGGGTEVLCSDLRALSGTAALETLVPTEPFAPGIISALLLRLYGGPPPSAEEPWLVPRDRYTGRCESVGGANVLRITPVGPVRQLTPSPDASWGTHLVDVNLPLGNLLRLLDTQLETATATRRRVTVRLGAFRSSPGRRQLVASVTGDAGSALRVRLLRGGRFLTRRTLSLNASGAGRVRFRVSRAGSYAVTVQPTSGGGGPAVRSKVRRVTLR